MVLCSVEINDSNFHAQWYKCGTCTHVLCVLTCTACAHSYRKAWSCCNIYIAIQQILDAGIMCLYGLRYIPSLWASTLHSSTSICLSSITWVLYLGIMGLRGLDHLFDWTTDWSWWCAGIQNSEKPTVLVLFFGILALMHLESAL